MYFHHETGAKIWFLVKKYLTNYDDFAAPVCLQYQVKNLAVDTTWQEIPYNFNVFIWKVDVLKLLRILLNTTEYSSSNIFSGSNCALKIWFSLKNDIVAL